MPSPDERKPMSELTEREVADRVADDLFNQATTTLMPPTRGAALPGNKPLDQQQVEALKWLAAEVRALRVLLANSAT